MNKLKETAIGYFVFFLLICIAVSNLAYADYVEGSGRHDSREATLKKVLAATGAAFGWDQRAVFYTLKAYSTMNEIKYQRIANAPRVVGPDKQADFVNGQLVDMDASAYFLRIYTPANCTIPFGGTIPKNSNCALMEGFAIKVLSFQNDTEAEKDFEKFLTDNEKASATLKKVAVVTTKRFDFHGFPAFSSMVKFKTNKKNPIGMPPMNQFIWWAGHYRFETFYIIGKTCGKPDISPRELAEELYKNVVQYRLLGASSPVTTETPKKTFTVKSKPDHFKSPGDRVIVTAVLHDEKGKGIPGKKVTVSWKEQHSSKTTDATGHVSFVITHHDKKQKSYTLIVQTDGFRRKLVIPVTLYEAVVEKNPITGTPYAGIVSDGVSFLNITINTEQMGNGFLKIQQPKLGRIVCGVENASCKVIPVSGKSIVLKYIPPRYLKNQNLVTLAPFTDEAKLATNGAVGGGTKYFNGGRAPWAARDTINIIFENSKSETYPLSADILVARPPIMLVHGFTGDQTTWKDLQTWLGGEKFDGVIDEYYRGNQGINRQAAALNNNIEREEARYRAFGLKCSKVDIVGHSMGGLIARTYIQYPYGYKNNVRKLIMVGTPNHGVSFLDYAAGVFISDYLRKHQLAATQLYAKSAFMNALNKGEAAGNHLRKGVQYANIFGIRDDYVVPMSSAFLNGVRDRTIEHVAHSPAVPLPGIAITESKTVWRWIKGWLSRDIPRDRLKSVSVQIARGRGNIFKQTLTMRDGKIWESFSNVRNYPNKVEPWEDVGTGPNSKTLIHLTITGHQWGSIQLDENSLIELGFLSPKSVTVRVRKGSARFESLKSHGGGHFSVIVGPEHKGRWFTFRPNAKIVGLDTDFVITVATDHSVRADILEGRILLKSLHENMPNRLIVGAGKAVTVTPEGEIKSTTKPPSAWWKNPFYTSGKPVSKVSQEKPAVESRFSPIADAYVYAYNYRNWNRSNRGRYDQLVAGWHPTGGESRAYIRFDLNSVDPAAAGKAVLRMFHMQTAGNNRVDLGIYRVTSPWKEGSDTYHPGKVEKTAAPGEISWAQQPSSDATPVATFNPGKGLYDWTEVDITPLVKAWLNGTPNYGLVIKPAGHLTQSTPASVYHFASRERAPGLERPKGQSKVPVLMLYQGSAGVGSNTGIHHPQQPPSSQPNRLQNALGNPCAPDKEFVRSLYQSVLERDLDVSFAPGHGAAYLRSLQNRASREALTRAFFKSTEYANKHKGNREFLRDAYQAALGREPNSVELRQGIGASRPDFISKLFNSAEYRTRTANCLKNNGSPSGLLKLPFFDDFSQPSSTWKLPPGADTRSGKVMWNSETSNALRLNPAIPMENIVIEFDGHAETNGINVWLQNSSQKGYTIILGGWYNTKSGSDIGTDTENRELVSGKLWIPHQWQHYKIVRNGDILAAYCNGHLIFKRRSSNRFDGFGHLRFGSWKALIGIDNVRVYRALQVTTMHLKSGSYRLDHQVGGTVWHSTWRLKVNNGRIFGTSEWSCCPSHRIDPMKGYISGNSVVIERNCSGQGWKEPCRQIYKGEFKDGHIEGTASGTGLSAGNQWILYLDQRR